VKLGKKEGEENEVVGLKAEKSISVAVYKKVGRPNCVDKEKREALLSAYYAYPYSLRELAEMFGVSRMTVWRVVQDANPSEVKFYG
jgi:DNA invertase Pin-like site-specific DNA recombinase